MVNSLIGYKVGMTQLFVEGGASVPVTVLQMGPCHVVQIKTLAKEGYSAAQLAFDAIAEKKVSRPLMGHFKKANVDPGRVLREVHGDLSGISVGQVITAEIFEKGERVDVSGTSIGKGFQGVMKRHHFAGGPATHGSMFHRAPGSIGASSYPSRVWKNKKLPGHMGSEHVTTQGVTVIEVRSSENLIFVRGSVPGSPHSLVVVHKSRRGVKSKAPAKG